MGMATLTSIHGYCAYFLEIMHTNKPALDVGASVPEYMVLPYSVRDC